MRKRVKLILPPLWSNASAPGDQWRAIKDPARISVVAAGTKTGKTWGGAEWFVEQGLKHRNAYAWWLAPSVYQATIGFNRAKDLMPEHFAKVNHSKMTIELPTGTMLEFKTAEKPNLLFGQEVAFAVVDEAARMREAAWTALMTTMTRTQGPVRVFSNTDQGQMNWFYGLYKRGTDPNEADFSSWKLRTYENPFIPAIAIQRMKRDLPPHLYAAFVEAEFPSESSGAFRNLKRVIDASMLTITTPQIEAPIHGTSYVMGVDLAKWRHTTVLVVMKLPEKRVVYYQRLPRPTDWEKQYKIIDAVCTAYNRAQTLVDSTGVGDPVLERLLTGYHMPVTGYDFTGRSKLQLFESLMIGVEQGNFVIPYGLTDLLDEMRALTVEVDDHGNVSFELPKSGIEGMIGEGKTLPSESPDGVVALALCYMLAKSPFEVGYMSIAKSETRREEARSGMDRRPWPTERGY